MRVICATAAALAFAPLALAGGTLYENPFDPTASASQGLPSEFLDGGFYNQRIADNFSLAVGSTIEQLVFWASEEGFFSDGWPGNVSGFVLEVYADNSGIPGSLLDSQSFGVGSVSAVGTGVIQFNGSEIMEITVDVADVNLAAGNYHYGISGEFVESTQNDDSLFLALGTIPGVAVASPPSGAYVDSPNDPGMAFRLVGSAIPTPGALALLGAAGLMARRRRRA